MKTLTLIRHAKSSWEDPRLADHRRPLNKRGRRDAPRMGRRLAARNIRPQLLLSSPAVRALTTAEAIASELGWPPGGITTDADIYHASSDRLLDLIRNLDDCHTHVMLVGHNPGLTDLVEQLAQAGITNLPTCGLVILGFSIDHWQDAADGGCELLAYDYPKNM